MKKERDGTCTCTEVFGKRLKAFYAQFINHHPASCNVHPSLLQLAQIYFSLPSTAFQLTTSQTALKYSALRF
jgi:hypothetical protein